MHTLISTLAFYSSDLIPTFPLGLINHAMHFQQQLLINVCITFYG